MEATDYIASYAAIVSTVVGFTQLVQWYSERVGAQLKVSPRVNDMNPENFSHIEVDIQATVNPTTIQAVYIAAYKSWWHWLFRCNPAEVIGNDWSKIFPKTIDPGHGWEGLLAINDNERALKASYSHIRIMVRHTGNGRIVSKPVTKILNK